MQTMTRRRMLALAGGAAVAPLRAAPQKLSKDDDLFLEELSRRSFQYFWEFTDPDTGMTRGRAKADGTPYDPNRRYIGSIAVTGFGLAGLCIAAERGWVKAEEARTRVRNGLRFFAEHAPQEHGWFFHWMNVKEGRRTGVLESSAKKSELSSIDNALLMRGIPTVQGSSEKDAEIKKLATVI